MKKLLILLLFFGLSNVYAESGKYSISAVCDYNKSEIDTNNKTIISIYFDCLSTVIKSDNKNSLLSRFNMEWVPAIVTILILIMFTALVVVMFFGSTYFAPPRDEAITFKKIIDVLWGRAGVTIFYNTLVIGIGAGAMGTFIGTIYAWILVRTNAPGKKFLRILAIIPLTMPALVKSIGWVAILSPSIGIFNTLGKDLFGLVLFDLYTLEGCVFVMGISSLSLSYLLMEPAIQSVSSMSSKMS